MSVKLHLGCGNKYLSGYIHIDCNDLPHLDHITTIDNLPMFEDGSVDEIYSCGAFHYFDRIEAVKVLKEWRRVLKKNGDLRISLGDFEKIVQVYFESDKVLESRGILGPLFGRWPIVDSDGVERCIYQKTCYDFKSLKKILEENGFKDVKKYNWKSFLPEGYDDYSRAYIPHMDEDGLLLSLNVHGRRS